MYIGMLKMGSRERHIQTWSPTCRPR